jgi:ABC-2 type transport system ATP-binding protein
LDVLSKQAVREFLAATAARGDTTVVLTTHDLADIEKLCRRLVVIDHGRVVHDGSLESLHARYRSKRRIVADLDVEWPAGLELPGATVERVEGTRVTLSLDGATAGEVVARLAQAVPLRDLSVQEPEIEDVIARLYTS